MRFRLISTRQIDVGNGLVVNLDYDYASAVKGDALDRQIAPLFAQSGEMHETLRRIADGDIPGMPKFFAGVAPPLFTIIQDMARQALPEEKARYRRGWRRRTRLGRR